MSPGLSAGLPVIEVHVDARSLRNRVADKIEENVCPHAGLRLAARLANRQTTAEGDEKERYGKASTHRDLAATKRPRPWQAQAQGWLRPPEGLDGLPWPAGVDPGGFSPRRNATRSTSSCTLITSLNEGIFEDPSAAS
jgi:hypothetical protein